MINPETIEVEGKDKVVRKYIISDIPYLSGGREVSSQFVSTAVPKIGDYEANQKLSEIMFRHVAAVVDGREIQLLTKDLVNNHVPDFITGIKIEEAMLEKCLGFSIAGKVREFRQGLEQKGPALIIKTLTTLKDVFLKPDAAQGTNSKRSIRSKTR